MKWQESQYRMGRHGRSMRGGRELIHMSGAAGAGAAAGDASMERQRMLLADMATHLLQTALKPGPIELDKLRNNLHAILTISVRFLPGAGLKGATAGLVADRSEPEHS